MVNLSKFNKSNADGGKNKKKSRKLLKQQEVEVYNMIAEKMKTRSNKNLSTAVVQSVFDRIKPEKKFEDRVCNYETIVNLWNNPPKDCQTDAMKEEKENKKKENIEKSKKRKEKEDERTEKINKISLEFKKLLDRGKKLCDTDDIIIDKNESNSSLAEALYKEILTSNEKDFNSSNEINNLKYHLEGMKLKLIRNYLTYSWAKEIFQGLKLRNQQSYNEFKNAQECDEPIHKKKYKGGKQALASVRDRKGGNKNLRESFKRKFETLKSNMKIMTEMADKFNSDEKENSLMISEKQINLRIDENEIEDVDKKIAKS